MRDVSSKPNSLRTAKATAILRCSAQTIDAIRTGNVPKADPLGVARVAAIQAAKNTSVLIPYCHQVPLDFVGVQIDLEQESMRVLTEVKAVWKTGVEMEALSAAAAAALTLYDMLKIIDERMEIGAVRLLEKKGGKSDFVTREGEPLRAAVVVLSDKASRGEREDRSGKAIKERLEQSGLSVHDLIIIPDEAVQLRATLIQLCDEKRLNLVLTTGGTGLGPRDITPETTTALLEKELPGVAERLRAFGQERNRFAMLSRGVAGIRGGTLIVNLPGSVNAVHESLDVLFPWLLHAFPMLRGNEH